MKRDCPLNVSRPTYGTTVPSSVAVPAQTTRSMAQPMGKGTSSKGAQSGMRGQIARGRGQVRAFVTGTLIICSRQALVLFDLGATRSFVSSSFVLC